LFSQQSFDFKIPKGELTQEDKNKIYEQFGLGLIDKDGNHRITFEEAYSQLPEEWRTPDLEHQMRQQFEEVDTDKSGDVDMDEFIAYWRKTVEPLLEAYEQQMGSFAAEYGSYQVSYPANGDSQWDPSYGGDNWSSYGGDWNSDYQWSSYGEWNGDSSYEWNSSQYESWNPEE
jgi:hypothetical protein